MTDKEVLIPSRSKNTQEKVLYTPLGQLTEDRTGQASSVIDTENQKDDRSAGVTTRKNVYILLGIAVLAVAVIVLSVVFTVYSGTGLTRSRRSASSFSFEDIFGYKFYARRYEVTWISDYEYLVDKIGDVYKIDLKDKSSKIILSQYTLHPLNGTQYWISPDHKYFLIASNVKNLYRYSFFADYYLHKIETNESIKLQPPAAGKVRYASWTTTDNGLVYVFQNDIYWRSSAEDDDDVRITTTGKDHQDVIFNGIPDWVYEEEVFAKDNTIWFSEDGQSLCYATFNDTNVKYFKYPIYGPASDSYGSIHRIAYPKPGTPNPTVTVHVVSLKNLKREIRSGNARAPVRLEVPAQLKDSDHYMTQVSWINNDRVNVQWLNREQTVSIVAEYQASTGQEVHQFEETVSKGWIIEKYPAGVYLKNEKFYLNLMAVPQSSGNGNFIHLVKIGYEDTTVGEVSAITAGDWEVTDFWYDEEGKRVYFISTEISPTQRHLYRINLDGTDKECLTCKLASFKDDRCKYFYADFSKGRTYYVLSCSGPGVPQTSLHNARNNTAGILEENIGLKRLVDSMALPTYRYFNITVKDSDGSEVRLVAKETLPPDFNMNKKYAVLFYVYGGPGSQMVTETFGLSFSAYLVSNFDMIVVNVDARGSGFRGESFKHAVYKQLGKFESYDTIAAGKYMMERSYVDSSKLAVWGWSYGGYLTSYILGTGTDVFKCGMAVAPVADWHYYDSIYTERYMRLPSKEDNFDGYQESSVLPHCKNFKNDTYLLVHGTGDDNVHFKNAAELSRSLVEAHVSYRVQFYTDKTHGLFGSATRRHLYWLLSTYLQQCLAM